MRSVVLVLLLISLPASAVTLALTPVECQYTEREATVVPVKTECSTEPKVSICSADVACNGIDVEALETEFGGDRQKAAVAARSFLNNTGPIFSVARDVVKQGKFLWSEIAKTRPKFLTYNTRAYCRMQKSGQCPSALACVLDKKVENVKHIETEQGFSAATETNGAKVNQ